MSKKFKNKSKIIILILLNLVILASCSNNTKFNNSEKTEGSNVKEEEYIVIDMTLTKT